jgi:hypothetical protein
MTEICPVCGSINSQQIVRRDNVPVLLNRLYPTWASARAAASGTLDIHRCNGCGFAWNTAFDPRIVVYDDDYENDQTYSPTFVAHMQDRAEDIAAAVPHDAMLDYLEVGCGQGAFIGKIAQATAGRLRSASGFDPAWRGADMRGPNGSCIYKACFDETTAGLLSQTPNVVASRHTIEHIPDPMGFLRSLRLALGAASQARMFIETPCIDWIIEHEAVQDFFYEHCSLFTRGALHYSLEASGFRVNRISHVFGGQYLWAEATAAENVAVSKPSGGFCGEFASVEQQFISRWRTAVENAVLEGPAAIWGGGAKGVMFSLLVDPDNVLLDHAIDINPRKQGLHFAGCGLPVLSPRQSAARLPRTIFVMNSNYMGEIAKLASGLYANARLVSVQ